MSCRRPCRCRRPALGASLGRCAEIVATPAAGAEAVATTAHPRSQPRAGENTRDHRQGEVVRADLEPFARTICPGSNGKKRWPVPRCRVGPAQKAGQAIHVPRGPRVREEADATRIRYDAPPTTWAPPRKRIRTPATPHPHCHTRQQQHQRHGRGEGKQAASHAGIVPPPSVCLTPNQSAATPSGGTPAGAKLGLWIPKRSRWGRRRMERASSSLCYERFGQVRPLGE